MLQVAAEFKRITNVDMNIFYDSLDSHLSRLEGIFTTGTGKKSAVMKQLLESTAGNEVSYMYYIMASGINFYSN